MDLRMFQPSPVSAQASLLQQQPPPWHAPHTTSHALCTLYQLDRALCPTVLQFTYGVVEEHTPARPTVSIPDPLLLILSFRCNHVIIVSPASTASASFDESSVSYSLSPTQVIHPDHSKFTPVPKSRAMVSN